MCTAITFHSKDHYFGRNLDLEHSYGESVLITPRSFPLSFRMLPPQATHHAMIGVGLIREGYPLYYDAVNETGLAMAGLNFPGNAHYPPPQPDMDNVAPFELIPWVLGQCATLAQARGLLTRVNLAAIDFSPKLPRSPLHWIIADRTGAVTVEATSASLNIWDNPVGVLTNNPPFDYHITHLASFLNLSRNIPKNRFSPTLSLTPYSAGMGAIGLPGDLSSPSRFVRAAFIKENSRCGPSEQESVNQVFHILTGVEQQLGCVCLGPGQYEHTVYSSCCNLDQGLYYYTTYENRAVNGVDLRREPLDTAQLITYPMLRPRSISMQN